MRSWEQLQAERAARRQEIIDDYLAGMTARECAEKYGLTFSTIKSQLCRWGVSLPPEEMRRRAQLAAAKSADKRMVWPDCPAHLRTDYLTLSRYMSRREARAQLEGRV